MERRSFHYCTLQQPTVVQLELDGTDLPLAIAGHTPGGITVTLMHKLLHVPVSTDVTNLNLCRKEPPSGFR